MHYNLLGRTGLFVSELCLGTMTMGGRGYWEVIGTLGITETENLIKTFHEAGGNFIDTADGYGFGHSEELVGAALKKLGIARHEWVVATKGMLRMGPDPNNVGLSRYHITRAIDASLSRLQLDHIDLYQIHGVDALTPLEETLRALEDAQRAGKVGYIGVCNMPAWMMAKANGIADQMGWARFVSSQNYYSLAGRDLEHEIIPYTQDSGMAVLPWSPLAGGFLSGKFRANEANPEGARRSTFNFPPVNTELSYKLVEVLAGIAHEIGATIPQVALAGLMKQKGVTSVIMGAKTEAQLKDNLGASAVKDLLTADHLAAIDAASKPEVQYPYWMMERQHAARTPGNTF